MKEIIYKSFIIRKCTKNKKLCAYNYQTDYFINPLFDGIEEIKKEIDQLNN